MVLEVAELILRKRTALRCLPAKAGEKGPFLFAPTDRPEPRLILLLTQMEVTQHARYTCTFCGKASIPFAYSQRTAVGIWSCRACKKTIAGGAWTVSTTAAATVRSTVRRLRELTEA
ncbi:60S ribosomal protein L37a [Lanmaoa asiatica]|nr:60S ribosomal protein L37a [Lanmaoa asiatica]